MSIMKAEDEFGTWKETILKSGAKARSLIAPSVDFEEWRFSPPIETEPVRDLASEIDELKAEIKKLKK